MSTSFAPVKKRPFRLTYPFAFAASALIVGGAPPSSGLTGCAAPRALAPPVLGPIPSAAPVSSVKAAGMAGTASAGLIPEPPLLGAASLESSLPKSSEPAEPSGTEPSAPPLPVPSGPPHNWHGGEFQHALSELSTWVKKNGGSLGAELDDVSSGKTLGSVAAHSPENPASNQKILTTAAALRHLGASFRFRTSLCGARSGDAVPTLVIRGTGDPSLSSDDVHSLVKALVEIGVRRIGDLLVDQSFFDARFAPPAFEQQPNEWAAFRAPVSAVSLNRNVTTLNVAPGEPGRSARAWFEPEGFVDLTGSVRTEDTRELARSKTGERSQDVRLTLKQSGMRLAAEIAGSIAPDSPVFHWARRVEDPSLLAGYGFKAALSAANVQVSGKIAVGGADERVPLVTHESRPLSELLPELGKDSDNFYAETLLKDLGAKVKGAPGTSENGAAVVLDYLREIDAYEAGTQIVNGSGLFDANRISAHTLVKTLENAYRDAATASVFVDQLAVGGLDGTLKHRFSAFKKQRSIRAKTGTLDRVIALSGYAFRPDGTYPIAFSLLVSGIGNHAEVRKRVDDIVSNVARVLARDAS